MWWDNFSKTYACGLQGIDSGAYRSALWTGTGVHEYVGDAVDISVNLESPGMPSKLALPDQRSVLKAAMTRCDDGGELRWKKSLVHKLDVRRLPLNRLLTP